VPINLRDSDFGAAGSIACDGVYGAMLQKFCEEATYDPYAALMYETDEQTQQCRREHEQRTAALIRERSGEPLMAQSAHLASGLPSPFQPFSRSGQRCFAVTLT
jgi:hypothetical protein